MFHLQRPLAVWAGSRTHWQGRIFSHGVLCCRNAIPVIWIACSPHIGWLLKTGFQDWWIFPLLLMPIVLGYQGEEWIFPVKVSLWLQLYFSRDMEWWGKSSLNFKMWTADRSSAYKLQEGLNSQGLAKRQGGHGWLGPRARAPTVQEPSWGFLPGPPQLDASLDARWALCCFSWIMETSGLGQDGINEAED